MRHVKSYDKGVRESVLLEAATMAGHFTTAVTPNCDHTILANYQNCFDVQFNSGGGDHFPPLRCRVKLPPRDRLPQRLCVERNGDIGPYRAYRKDEAIPFAGQASRPELIPIMSDAELEAVELYEKNLERYKKAATSDTGVWADAWKHEEECWGIYEEPLAELQRAILDAGEKKVSCKNRLVGANATILSNGKKCDEEEATLKETRAKLEEANRTCEKLVEDAKLTISVNENNCDIRVGGLRTAKSQMEKDYDAKIAEVDKVIDRLTHEKAFCARQKESLELLPDKKKPERSQKWEKSGSVPLRK